MLSIVLVFIASLFASYKSDNKRLIVCLVVLAPAIFHLGFFSDSSGFAYYVTAGCASLIVISMLEWLPRSPLVSDIQVINFVYIIAHGIGYAMYHSYMEPVVYNAVVLTLFVIEFARLMISTDKDNKHGIRNRDDTFRNNGPSRRIGDIN